MNKKSEAYGVLLFDKPSGVGSNTALQRVKKLLHARKGGHTGSLDPIATGLLPLCFGEATKVAGYFLNADKTYQVRIRLGINTDTGDADGQVVSEQQVRVSKRQVRRVLKEFVGVQEQTPPMYSAVKVDGKRLYKYAREGRVVERQPRTVEVYSITLNDYSNECIDLDVKCSSGFYVRVLAQEIGKRLKCGAHVESLRRLSVANLTIDKCVALDELERLETVDERRALLMPSDQALEHLPKVSLSMDAAYFLCRGQSVRAGNLPDEGVVRLYDQSAGFLGIGQSLGDGRVAPKRLFSISNDNSVV